MGRPKGSKNQSTLVKEKVDTKPDKDAIQVTIGERQKYVGDHYYSIKFWQNVPTDLIPTKETPPNTRVVYADQPETRFFLVKVILPGETEHVGGSPWPEGGVIVNSPNSGYTQRFRLPAIMIHSKKAVYEPVPEGFEHFTGGHRKGSQAAEKAAKREAKRQKKAAKEEAKRTSKELKLKAREERLNKKKNRVAPAGFKYVKSGKRGRPKKVKL